MALCAGVPVLALFADAAFTPSAWSALFDTRFFQLLSNTLLLSLTVAAGSLLLGTTSAWLLSRWQFPGRKGVEILCLVPLVIPPYVLAYIYVTVTGPAQLLASWPAVRGFWGTTLVLTLAGFPYVFLSARAALAQYSRSLEEAARIMGASPRQVFWRVALPLLRPSLVVGVVLVIMHVLADFGTVSLLRYQTLTWEIYQQFENYDNYSRAAALSSILVLISVLLLVLEQRWRGRRQFAARPQAQAVARQANGREMLLILLWFAVLLGFAVVLPLGLLVQWTWQAVLAEGWSNQLWQYLQHSFIVALAVAGLAMLLALPVALLQWLRPAFFSRALVQLSSVGFALPGVVAAVAVFTVAYWLMPAFSSVFVLSFIVLVIALMIRFLPLAVQNEAAALSQIKPSVLEAARMLGYGMFGSVLKALLPVLRRGLGVAVILVFVETLKELPMTLMMRPLGFDTLTVRIWLDASEEMLELAAPAALLLIVASLPVLWILRKQ